jgi:hypothetical protein
VLGTLGRLLVKSLFGAASLALRRCFFDLPFSVLGVAATSTTGFDPSAGLDGLEEEYLRWRGRHESACVETARGAEETMAEVGLTAKAARLTELENMV